MINFLVYKDSFVDERTNKNGGKYYLQTVWGYLVNRDGSQKPHPVEIKVILPKDQYDKHIVYPEGNYTLSPAAIGVNQYASLVFNFPMLLPAK
tara:strand:- start:405 stop:683 length:279 start_codon:yes stop_codon:yes gene_type:complete